MLPLLAVAWLDWRQLRISPVQEKALPCLKKHVNSAARYHSLFAVQETLPAVLRVTAASEDGVVMAVEHSNLPIAAVQFHPESILTLQEDLGLRLIHNVVAVLTAPRKAQAA